jgi:hypothetical protein
MLLYCLLVVSGSCFRLLFYCWPLVTRHVSQVDLIADTIVIGRKAGCDVVLPQDTRMSSRHCRILRPLGEPILIEDLRYRCWCLEWL